MRYTCKVTREYGEIPAVMGSANQLGQVFVNLLVNAGQAIEPGRHGEIKVRTYDGAGYVEVGGDGMGIAPESLARVFDPFFTTKPVGQGTGLGLSISYGIVERHQGKIHVASEVGVGTTFTVELPVEVR